jgi:D-3-phosphoglycerate dehydrogenase
LTRKLSVFCAFFAPLQLQAKNNSCKISVLMILNLVKKLADEGVTIVGDMETYDYGKFG